MTIKDEGPKPQFWKKKHSRKKGRINPKTWAQNHGHPEMTAEEEALCRPVYEVDQLRAPVPTYPESNGEYLPPLQNIWQKQVEARVRELAAAGAQRLNISRRQFLQTCGGMAASFLAMNEVFGKFSYAQSAFKVAKEGMFDQNAFLADGPPSDLFIVDDQCHLLRGADPALNLVAAAARSAFQGEDARPPNSPFVFNMNNPPNPPMYPEGVPDEHGLTWATLNPKLIGHSNFDGTSVWLHAFIKYLYFDSQTTIGILMGQPTGLAGGFAPQLQYLPIRNVNEARAVETLAAAQGSASREFINGIAGSTRALWAGLLYLGRGNLHYLQEQVDQFQPDIWKGYQWPSAKRDNDPSTVFEEWTFDDEELAFPTFEFIRDVYRKNGHLKPGLNCVCVHKGVGLGNDDPADIPAAAQAFPELNFIIYHSCTQPQFYPYTQFDSIKSGELLDGVPNVPSVTKFAQLLAPYPNVYAELGVVFPFSCVNFPTVAMHVMGILLKYFGADRIVWGTDTLYVGDPQWIIEALWRLQIPEEMQKRYCYPAFTDEMKRKILGLNWARLLRMTPDLTKYTAIPGDYADRMRADCNLMRTMEYDNVLLNQVPEEGLPNDGTLPSPCETSPQASIIQSPYGVATAKRNDRFDLLRAHYKQLHGTKHGVPRDNRRFGWVRVKS